MDLDLFEERKREHIRLSLDSHHQAVGLSGLDQIHLLHDALPELDFDQIRLESLLLGKPSPVPFFVSGMTAGHRDAASINRLLAEACAARGWSLGIGSQRRDLDGGASVDQWQQLRAEFPKLNLFANLGASQLPGLPLERVERLVQAIDARVLMIHLNSLQECMQPEGTPQFRGVLQAIQALAEGLSIPVALKETGCGFSPLALAKLQGRGVRAIDVSGLGGTHWGRIEGARAAQNDPLRAQAAETFANWGESTVNSVLAARRVCPEIEVWASGGVRTGLEAAKLIALGASQVGYAKPALEAALQGAAALAAWMTRQEFELKIALFCTGSISPEALQKKEGIWKSNVN